MLRSHYRNIYSNSEMLALVHKWIAGACTLLSGEIGLLEHLWGRSPFSVRRGAEVAQRADRGDTHTQTRKDFTQLRAARMRKTLLLPVWIDSSSCSGAQEATVSLELGRG